MLGDREYLLSLSRFSISVVLLGKMKVAGNRSRRKDYVLSTPLPLLSPLLLLSFLVGLNLPTTGCTLTGGCFCEVRVINYFRLSDFDAYGGVLI